MPSQWNCRRGYAGHCSQCSAHTGACTRVRYGVNLGKTQSEHNESAFGGMAAKKATGHVETDRRAVIQAPKLGASNHALRTHRR